MDLRKKYEEEDAEYDRYSMHIAGIKAKERVEARAEEKAENTYFFVQNCLKEGLPIPVIARLIGLSEKEIEKIATS
jgi:hypothetical protein